MAVQEDIIPAQKMALTLVLFTFGTIVAVFIGQWIYLAVQDTENVEKLIQVEPGMEEVRLEQQAQLAEYRVVDEENKRVAIPIEQAMKLVGEELGQADN